MSAEGYGRRAGVEVVLDRPRLLLLNFNALAEIEETFEIDGLDAQAVFDLFKSNKVSTLRTLAWIMLKQEDPDLTLEAVGRLITYRVSKDILKAMLLAFSRSHSTDEDEDPASPNGVVEHEPGEAVALGG